MNAGFKVGVVSQTETAALKVKYQKEKKNLSYLEFPLKAAGANRNTMMTRDLTQVFTKATLIDRGTKEKERKRRILIEEKEQKIEKEQERRRIL